MAKILGFVILATLLAQDAMACVKAPGWRVEDDIQQADAIFVGEVQKIEIRREWAPYENGRSELGGGIVFPEHGVMYRPVTTFTVSVDRAWRGIDNEIVEVTTDWSSCEADLRVARRYLFYAYETPDGGLAVNTFGARQPGAASKDFELLGSPVRNFFDEKIVTIRRRLAAESTYREEP